jgi:hypothetical protein
LLFLSVVGMPNPIGLWIELATSRRFSFGTRCPA